MPFFDISVAIAPGATPVYPGDPPVEFEQWAALSRGDAANVTMLHMGAHTGTHVDAPAHFIEGGSAVSAMALDALIGPARVVDIPSEAMTVEAAHVEAASLGGAERVLFKTRNSSFWEEPRGRFREDFTYVTHEAARALVRLGVRLVGIDYLSVEKFRAESFETHTTLLSAGVVIVEGLDLRAVTPGEYELICLPLRLAAGTGDGAPCRAVLRTID